MDARREGSRHQAGLNVILANARNFLNRTLAMIYMVDHVFGDAALEPAWHEWYAGYLQKLLAVPGIHSAQRFKAIGITPSRYLAMYSVDSADVFTSRPYKDMGGGGSQSARFHPAYQLWTRNLFDGAERAPAVPEGQKLRVLDASRPQGRGNLVWLYAVGLHMTTKYRALVVLDAAEPAVRSAGSFVYEPFTPPLEAHP
jgi:hypothetical protein